jgi:hypothetical protein
MREINKKEIITRENISRMKKRGQVTMLPF